MYKDYKKTYSLVCTFAAICLTGSCLFKTRFPVENALVRMKQIRASEAEFKKNNSRFGSLQELVDSKMISADLSDGYDENYQFRLAAEKDGYTLEAIPTGDVGSCFYLDETGIIRASYNFEIPAGKSSPAIKNQD